MKSICELFFNQADKNLRAPRAAMVPRSPVPALSLLFGVLNNGLICVLYGAAQDLVSHFNEHNAATSVTIVATASALVGPALLAGPLKSTGFRTRMWICSGFALAGLLLAAFTCMSTALRGPSGLFVMLIATFLLGLQQSIGENAGCIRFQCLPPIALSCWGAGTGIAGVVMPLLYTLIEEVSLAARFLYMLPVLAMYLVAESGRRPSGAAS